MHALQLGKGKAGARLRWEPPSVLAISPVFLALRLTPTALLNDSLLSHGMPMRTLTNPQPRTTLLALLTHPLACLGQPLPGAGDHL